MTVPSMVAEEVLYTDVPDSQYCTLLMQSVKADHRRA